MKASDFAWSSRWNGGGAPGEPTVGQAFSLPDS